MAPDAGGDLAFGSGSFGLSQCGQQHVRELEQDVAGGRFGNPAVVERKVGMVFGGSGSSGDDPPQACIRIRNMVKGLKKNLLRS